MKNISEVEEIIQLQNPEKYMSELWQKVDFDITYNKYQNSLIKPNIDFFGYVSPAFFNIYYNEKSWRGRFVRLKISGKLVENKLIIRFKLLDSIVINIFLTCLIGLYMTLSVAYYTHWSISLAVLFLFLVNFLIPRHFYLKSIMKCIDWFESMNV